MCKYGLPATRVSMFLAALAGAYAFLPVATVSSSWGIGISMPLLTGGVSAAIKAAITSIVKVSITYVTTTSAAPLSAYLLSLGAVGGGSIFVRLVKGQCGTCEGSSNRIEACITVLTLLRENYRRLHEQSVKQKQKKHAKEKERCHKQGHELQIKGMEHKHELETMQMIYDDEEKKRVHEMQKLHLGVDLEQRKLHLEHKANMSKL